MYVNVGALVDNDSERSSETTYKESVSITLYVLRSDQVTDTHCSKR